MQPWGVERYSIERLRALLDEASAVNRSSDTVHDAYFEEYFRTIGAKSIVVERGYIDRDYLEDYAAYYVRCFQPYARSCTRLHFFSTEITSRDVENMLDGSTRAANKLVRSYQGFIVVRPAPQRPVGRACLVTYPSDEERRYANLRRYDANLFGLSLSVQSLAFQQQDRAVAACATSALWSAFQASGKLFGHRIPSPAEITVAASRRIPLDTRTLPASAGLTPEQMADAIRAYDLEPVLIGCKDPALLKAAVYGYAGAGIPLVLVGSVIGENDEDIARHAVTITGYRFEGERLHEGFVSDRIAKLYAHDDGVGPFARMTFVEHDEALLTTSLADSKRNIGKRRFRPELALVPVYHKIRIPLERVLREVLSFQQYISGLRNSGDEASSVLPMCDWDVRLMTLNEYRSELRSATVPKKRAMLESPLPRYLWVVRATQEERGAVDFAFDATGIEADNLCSLCVERGSRLPETLRALGLGSDAFVGAEGMAAALLG